MVPRNHSMKYLTHHVRRKVSLGNLGKFRFKVNKPLPANRENQALSAKRFKLSFSRSSKPWQVKGVRQLKAMRDGVIHLVAAILLVSVQFLGCAMAIATRFPGTRDWASTGFHGILALLAGIALAACGQSHHVWGSCLVTVSVMILLSMADFTQPTDRKSV